MTDVPVRLGLRANAGQFALLVALNAFVGAMVGLERSVLPLVGKNDFGLASKSAILSFVVAFGVAKALANLAAGGLAHRVEQAFELDLQAPVQRLGRGLCRRELGKDGRADPAGRARDEDPHGCLLMSVTVITVARMMSATAIT